MSDGSASSYIHSNGHMDDIMWSDLHTWLLPLVEKWIWRSNIPLWHSQEMQVAEEITQETLLRVFQYSQRAKAMEVRPIASLQALSSVIARNYLHDRRRKDSHMLRYDQLHSNQQLGIASTIDPSEIAIDHVMLATIINKAANIIAHFPSCQKAALLTDLANISDPDETTSILEQALAQEGIQLYDYKKSPPQGLIEKQRHASLLYIAYKRLKKEFKE